MRKLITGKGIESELKRFVMREDEELFQQRVLLTQIITPSICNTLISPSKKIGRINPIVDSIKIKKANDTTVTVESSSQNEKSAVEKIRNGVKNFHGGLGFDRYYEERVLGAVYIDPNAWSIVVFDDYDNRWATPKPYPVLAPCEDVMNFEIVNNETQWVMLRKCIKYELTSVTTIGRGASKKEVISQAVMDGHVYQLYIEDNVIEFIQVDPKYHTGADGSFSEILPEGFPMMKEKVTQRLYKFSANLVFLVNYYDTKAHIVS